MAIDIAKGTHGYAFPSKVLAGMGGAHQFNITITANHDNGELVNRGAWNSFDNYLEASVPTTNSFAGLIVAQVPDDTHAWYVEVTAETELLFLYNSPVSEYPQKELQDPSLFFNKSGDVVKGYSLKKGDIIMLSDTLFNGTPVANKTLTFKTGKYVVAP